MDRPILDFTIQDILDFLGMILGMFKEAMAWLGILVLPEDGEYDNYPSE